MENLERNCFYRIMFLFSLISWHMNQASHARRWGFLFCFLTRGLGFCTEKLSWGGDFKEKISGRGLARGG